MSYCAHPSGLMTESDIHGAEVTQGLCLLPQRMSMRRTTFNQVTYYHEQR
jgi:hypothetical protein